MASQQTQLLKYSGLLGTLFLLLFCSFPSSELETVPVTFSLVPTNIITNGQVSPEMLCAAVDPAPNILGRD